VEFEGEVWGKEGKFVKGFIQRLLMPNPHGRLTVEEALKHFWLAEVTHHTPKWTMKSEHHQPCSRLGSKEA
jgi:serine/threonine protein kinase